MMAVTFPLSTGALTVPGMSTHDYVTSYRCPRGHGDDWQLRLPGDNGELLYIWHADDEIIVARDWADGSVPADDVPSHLDVDDPILVCAHCLELMAMPTGCRVIADA
jgi:hypothetical protein